MRELEQAAVVGIDAREQAVFNIDSLRASAGGRTAAAQLHDGVGAVRVAVDKLACGGQLAGRAIRLQLQARQGVGRDFVVTAAHLVPRELAVVVGVQRQHEVEVAQRYVPLAAQFPPVKAQGQIAVTRLVRPGRDGGAPK
ncbi:hypothetical protein ACHMW6_02870 [Pseudoduganella sp. UC29_106]|uniref:hypothetical protein n=1 Tax=Pseudoduganella sp. UC29_106 TaxID=3374553 RepID=UPI0037572B1E